MSKPDRESQLQLGEQQLGEWGIPPHAGVEALRMAVGRSPAADLAIAARLGAQGETASIEVLSAMETTTADKLVRKEIRRSLYRLERRGLVIPPSTAPKPRLVASGPVMEGYLSAVDGNGDQLVWLVKPRPTGVAHVFAVINDPDGLREVDLTETTRKALRGVRQQLLDKHELRMVEADWRYCDYLIQRAATWAAEKGHRVSGDYARLRTQLIKEPVTEMRALILEELDREAVRADAPLLSQSGALLEEKEFRTWFFDRETLRPYVEEALEVQSSPLVLAPAQQQDRIGAVAERAVAELFGGDLRTSWVRRLQEMAYFFHATQRPEQSKQALAVALALEGSGRGGGQIDFFERLTRTSLGAFLQMEEERQTEEAKTSLVLTPQQAAQEAQRLRR